MTDEPPRKNGLELKVNPNHKNVHNCSTISISLKKR